MTFVILVNNHLFVSKMKSKKKQDYLEQFQITGWNLKIKKTVGLVIQTSLDLHDFYGKRDQRDGRKDSTFRIYSGSF